MSRMLPTSVPQGRGPAPGAGFGFAFARTDGAAPDSTRVRRLAGRGAAGWRWRNHGLRCGSERAVDRADAGRRPDRPDASGEPPTGKSGDGGGPGAARGPPSPPYRPHIGRGRAATGGSDRLREGGRGRGVRRANEGVHHRAGASGRGDSSPPPASGRGDSSPRPASGRGGSSPPRASGRGSSSPSPSGSPRSG